MKAWNLSRRCGGPRFDRRKGAVWRSALGTIGIYIYPLKEFHWGRPGNFPRMQGMCGSMEPISKMWGAAFRPRVWRSALGGTRSGRLVSPTVSVAAAAVAANASARERSMLVRAVVREREWVRTAPESRVSGGYRLQVSWPQLLRVCSRRSSVTKEEAVMMMRVLITSPAGPRAS